MIQLHPDSQKLIDDTYSKYTQIPIPADQHTIDNQWVILHIYPYADTIQDEPQGFRDSLLCRVRVFLEHDKTYYELSSIDDIYIEIPNHTRIFKDGSTMIMINAYNHPIIIVPDQMLTVLSKK